MSEARTRVEVRDHILIITMTRHAKRNAIDGEMTLALDAALNRLEDEQDLWVAVITGGPDMFCAGTDMAATSGTPTPRGGKLTSTRSCPFESRLYQGTKLCCSLHLSRLCSSHFFPILH